MFGRDKQPPPDDDALRAQMRTAPGVWHGSEVSAECVLYPAGRTPTAMVLLHAGDASALLPLSELAGVSRGSLGIAESMAGRRTPWRELWFLTFPGGWPESAATEAMQGVPPDQVAVLAARTTTSMVRLATMTSAELGGLVAWAEAAAAQEQVARRA